MKDCTWTKRTALCVCTVVVFALLGGGSATSQTFTVLHTFTAGTDGHEPETGLAIDRGGKLYGTTYYGATGYGSVFQMRRAGTGWVLGVLYNFSGMDGSGPLGRPVFGPDGALYGTTQFGGHGCGVGCGVVYRLSPPPTVCMTASCPWIQTILYRFGGSPDGASPAGPLTFDAAGNIYGTTINGGASGKGTVFELMPSNGGWSESVLYSFSGGTDGAQPFGGVALDPAGNLFGTTSRGGLGNGTIFLLQPMDGSWVESTFHMMAGGADGANPVGGLISDGAETFYGTTTNQGLSLNGGTVFQFIYSQSGISYSVIDNLTADDDLDSGPHDSLMMDAAGNLYGTGRLLGHHNENTGEAFELTFDGQSWNEITLHTFGYFETDGTYPYSNLVLDADGNLYGTAMAGGAGSCLFPSSGCGTVYQIARQ